MTDTVRIATRASELALRQARMVQAALEARGTQSELVTFKTVGDKKLDESLSKIGAKGLFTKELEDALIAGKVDCCVHSLKDLPTDMPAGLAIIAMLEREDPRDVLVVNDRIFTESLDDLPRGSRVGTSSLRRRAQLLHRRSDLEVVELRGNVPTRLRKVDEGQVHAAILAGAGLKRLEAEQRIDAWLDAPEWLPAAGQGVIAVQAREDDARMRERLVSIHHAPSAFAANAERSLLAALDGGCQVPIGALLIGEGTSAVLHALVSDLHGKQMLRASLGVGEQTAEEVGQALAAHMRRDGATEILAAVRADGAKIPSPQPE